MAGRTCLIAVSICAHTRAACTRLDAPRRPRQRSRVSGRDRRYLGRYTSKARPYMPEREEHPYVTKYEANARQKDT
ncbi:hypothetical protein BC628DRAFT_1064589 [Trametes gibbosa]|nr:hypothetical protein BC628DRAFT_1064589 [Trametes gibbosa]